MLLVFLLFIYPQCSESSSPLRKLSKSHRILWPHISSLIFNTVLINPFDSQLNTSMSLSLDEHHKLRFTFLSKSYFSFGVSTVFSVHWSSWIIEDSATDHLVCCSLIPLSLKSIIWTGSSTYHSFCTLHSNNHHAQHISVLVYRSHVVFQKNTNHHACGCENLQSTVGKNTVCYHL